MTKSEFNTAKFESKGPKLESNKANSELADAKTPDNPIYHFFNELGIMEQLATTQLERALPQGLSKAQFGVLNHMVRLGKLESPAELASAFQVARPSMTNTVQKLAAKGFVDVVPHPKDGRSKIVQITNAGIEAREQAIAALVPLFQQIGEALGPEVFAAAVPLLQKVRVYLDENR